MAILDTSVLIDLMGRGRGRNWERAALKVEELVERGEEIVTTRLNVAELYVGVELAAHPQEEELRVQNLLEDRRILELDDNSARAFGRTKANMRAKGQPVPQVDLLIAAVAIANSQRIVTRDERHFSGIPGVVVESY